MVTVSASGGRDADLVTVIVPGDDDIDVAASERGDRLEIKIRGPGREVTVWWAGDAFAAGREERSW